MGDDTGSCYLCLMNYENILLEESEGIILITINRPQAYNALNKATITELYYFFEEEAPQKEGIKGVIITGAGDKSFVAGADIKEFAHLSAREGAELSQRGQDAFFVIERFNAPVIAAVNGFALGGGCELAMACHMRIAGEHAKFGQPEVNLGLIPGYGGTQRLIQYIGKGKAMELMLTADTIGAEEAYKMGLVNHVVPKGEEVKKARELIQKIATKGPKAVSSVIECVNRYFYEPGVTGFSFEMREFGQVCGTEDFKEGAAAFIEKRAPVFTGK